MTVRKPEDDGIIDAKLVDEEPEAPSAPPQPPAPEPSAPEFTLLEPAAPRPAPVPGPFVGRSSRREKAKPTSGGMGLVVLLLIGVLIAAIVWRTKLTEFYNRNIGPMFGEEAPAPKPAPAPLKEAPAVVPPAPAPTPAPGLAYSIIKRENVGVEGLQQFEFKVVVPATYQRDDLLRMARAIVASERRLGERHALRFLCFTDTAKTKPEDLFATVDWGPGGDFMKAADAVNKTPDKNEFSVRLKGAP